MKKYIKENKILVAAVIVFLALLVVCFVVKGIFFSGTSNALYGDRLKGIDEVKVTDNQKKEVISNLKGDSTVKDVECFLQGKIVNVVITVNDDVGSDTAKTLGGKVLEKFDDDQKEYYDFQVFVKKENGGNDFPIIGYRQNTKSDFVWTKDRAAS